MKEEQFDYVDFAREFICSYYNDLATQDRINAKGFVEAFEIRHDDKVLLEHIKAIINLFTKAKEELEKDETVQ